MSHRNLLLARLIPLFVSVCACLILSVGVALSAQDAPLATFISFDAPGSSSYTVPTAINRWGCIGLYAENGAFIREPDGRFVRVSPPRARSTILSSINSPGQVVGMFYDDTGQHGYLRNPNGTFMKVDAPGATNGTELNAINDLGQAVGDFRDAKGFHGFFWDSRHPSSFSVFDPPGSRSTFTDAINASGLIAGYYRGSDGNAHGFLRDPDGKIEVFKRTVPTVLYALNNAGWAAGTSVDPDTLIESGLLRHPHGRITFFYPGLTPTTDIHITGINDHEVIVGFFTYGPGGGVPQAFESDAQGNLTIFNLPFDAFETYATGINLGGQVIGYYSDSNGAIHGWMK